MSLKVLFWLSGVLAASLALPSAFFFALHLSTGEPVPLARAKALYRWAVVVVLATFNIVVFGRVIDGIRALV
jgi:hypothetical protein